jgi:hypothetical protein
MTVRRMLKARDIERLENTSFAAFQLQAIAPTIGNEAASDRACSDWSCSGGYLCCETATITASAVAAQCSGLALCPTQDSCTSCSTADACCPTAGLTQSLGCDTTQTIVTEILPTIITEVIGGPGHLAIAPETLRVAPQVPPGWKL